MESRNNLIHFFLNYKRIECSKFEIEVHSLKKEISLGILYIKYHMQITNSLTLMGKRYNFFLFLNSLYVSLSLI